MTRLAALVLASSALLALAVLDPAGWYPFGPSKWLVVSTGLSIAAALVVAGGRVVVVRRATAAAVAVGAVMTIAAWQGVEQRNAWFGTAERHFGALTWWGCVAAFVIGQSAGLDALDAVRRLAVLAGLAVGGAATLEALGWEPRTFDVDPRLSATLGSPAYLGLAAALLLPLALGVAADRRMARGWRACAAAAGATSSIALLGSGARSAWLGTLVAAAAGAWTCRARWHAQPRHRRAVAVALAGVGTALLVTATPVGSRIAATFDADAPGGAGRVAEWRVATRVLAHHPVLGVGPEGYRIAMADGVDLAYQQRYGREPQPDRAHSAPIDVALDGGLLALTAWGAFVALVVRHGARALRGRDPALVSVALALVAHAVGQLTMFPVAEVEPLVWLLAGLLVIATARSQEVRDMALPRAVALGAAALVAVVSATALVLGVRDVRADRAARDSIDAAADGRLQEAADRAEDAARARPDEVRLQLLVASQSIAAGRSSAVAERAVARALDASPRDPIARRWWVVVAVRRATQTGLPDDVDEARRRAEALVAEDDLRPESWRLLADALDLGGDAAAAADARARAATREPTRG